MKQFWKHDYLRTKFIQINSRACSACWECVDACEHGVIGKVHFLGHKHSHIDHPEQCTGCLKCVRACSALAITKILN